MRWSARAGFCRRMPSPHAAGRGGVGLCDEVSIAVHENAESVILVAAFGGDETGDALYDPDLFGFPHR